MVISLYVQCISVALKLTDRPKTIHRKIDMDIYCLMNKKSGIPLRSTEADAGHRPGYWFSEFYFISIIFFIDEDMLFFSSTTVNR
jgi:hypothetical protein